MEIIVLDHVKKIQFDIDNPPVQNYHALEFLPVGLYNLARVVRKRELQMASVLHGKIKQSFFSSDPFESLVLPCYFNWFSVSIVNYLRLVGLFDIMSRMSWHSIDIENNANHKQVKNHCTQFVKQAIPEIYEWRNKIAAHFAITDPNSKDNLGTLEFSIMNQVGYNKPYFETGGFSWVVRGKKSQLPKWALTETFERLSVRFWPQAELPKV